MARLASRRVPGVAFVATLLFAGLDAYACDCARMPAPLEAAREARYVFVGTVVEMERSTDPGDSDLLFRIKSLLGMKPDFGYEDVVVTFRISTKLKGDPPSLVAVRTATSSAACGYKFDLDAQYLVYVRLNGTQLVTGLCARNSPADHAGEEIAALQRAYP